MHFIAFEYAFLLVFLLPFLLRIKGGSFTFWGYALTYVLLVLALMRPIIEQEPIENEQYLHDVVLGVDLSYSMHAKDIAPSRLEKAKEVLESYVKHEQGKRFGVLGFSSNAIILSPMTQDGALLLHLVQSLDETLILTKSSAVMPVLELARKLSGARPLSVVLLSDGGDEVNYEKEVRYAKANDLIVNVMMLATPSGGTLELQDGSMLQDEAGHIVITRQNDAIALLADATGGVYTKDFGEIARALAAQEQEDKKTKTTITQNKELFYYFIAAAIVVFLVSVTTLKYRVRKAFVWIALLFGMQLQGGVLEPLYSALAQEAYKKGSYEQALFFYEKLPTPQGYFNAANCYYKLGMYEKALELYTGVRSSDPLFKSQVFYNKANTYVRLKEFEKARQEYLKALTLGYFKEADENYRFIKDAGEEKKMLTGRQESKEQKQNAQEESSSAKNKKEGGSSNMPSDASSQSGASDMKEKTQTQERFSTSQSKAKLSSKQYELINQRGVYEKKPW